MGAGENLSLMNNLAGVEGVVKDSTYGRCSKKPGAGDKVTSGVRKGVHISGSKSLIVKP
jgi:hypothetical protein